METIDAVKKLGGNIIGIGVLVDRSQKKNELGHPLYCCYKANELTYKPENCPLCLGGKPLVKPGGS